MDRTVPASRPSGGPGRFEPCPGRVWRPLRGHGDPDHHDQSRIDRPLDRSRFRVAGSWRPPVPWADRAFVDLGMASDPLRRRELHRVRFGHGQQSAPRRDHVHGYGPGLLPGVPLFHRGVDPGVPVHGSGRDVHDGERGHGLQRPRQRLQTVPLHRGPARRGPGGPVSLG